MSKKEEKVTTKKKVAKKTAAKKVTTKKTAVKKTTAKAAAPKLTISPRERYEMIATMAFYRAEQRNFEPGHDVEDWLDCESTIDRMIKG